MDASSAQVKVVFTTNEEDLVLPESRRQLLVPAGENLPKRLIQRLEREKEANYESLRRY
jgi:hypothetical protein